MAKPDFEYFEKLCKKIQELHGENSDLSDLLNRELNKFLNNILYKSPEQLPLEFRNFNIKIGKIIYEWINENGGHDSEFALTLKTWIQDYFK